MMWMLSIQWCTNYYRPDRNSHRRMEIVWTAVRACLTCFQAPAIDLNGRQLEIERLLGEGGFAYVYLVRDRSTGKHWALKKIRCPFGGESVANAMREVEACTEFRGSPHVIECRGSAVRQEADGTRTVLMLLPYYSRGNLQDRISENVINEETMPESEVIDLALRIAVALRSMHWHRQRPASTEQLSQEHENQRQGNDNGEQVALLDDDEAATAELGEVVPWAHRDIKPANIMFDDAGEVILMDLGSCSQARMHVTTRQQALELQDMAAEHCTLPYRAPELFDVKTGRKVDERVDVWSFGCTVYAMMYGMSPFEREEQVAGASLQLAASTGRYSFPDQPQYSQELRDIVKQCLTHDPELRPTIDTIVERLREIQPQGGHNTA